MKISNREISSTQTPYIIAEISCNHRGSIELAQKTILAAVRSGADAVKIQCYTADGICGSSGVIPSGPWKGKRYKELYKEAETPPSMVREIVAFCRTKDIEVFSSVFDFEGVELAIELNLPAIKISSFDITDHPLIDYATLTGKPVIISTGNSSDNEIKEAVHAFNYAGGRPSRLALLHCISSYPCDPSEADLPRLALLRRLGGIDVVGFSDHTIGVGSAVAAVAMGASIIEKHFILDRAMGGPDAAFSMEPSEFRVLTSACGDAWKASKPAEVQHQQENLVFRKSLYTTKSLKRGDVFSRDNLRPKRPAGGIAPSSYAAILGRKAARDLEGETRLEPDMIS